MGGDCKVQHDAQKSGAASWNEVHCNFGDGHRHRRHRSIGFGVPAVCVSGGVAVFASRTCGIRCVVHAEMDFAVHLAPAGTRLRRTVHAN